MKAFPSIIIVGAGIFGVTAALELRRRGYSVALFDPGPLPHPDAASTDISKVIRMDYGTEDFYMDLMEEAFAGWEAWNAQWSQPLYHQTGMIFLNSHGLAPGEFEYESFIRLEQRGVPVKRLDNQAIQQRFPAWSSSHNLDGYYNPRAGWAESAEVVARLLRKAKTSGVLLFEGQTFAGLLESGSRVNGIVTKDGSRYHSEVVILAGGSWTPVLLPHLSNVMWPVGQPVFHFLPDNVPDYRPPEFPVWGLDVHTSGWYGFPATNDGILKVANHGPGWRMDPSGPRIIPPSEEDRFRQFFHQFLPSLADAPLFRTRLCFYCDTFDGDFWIDHDPDREGLLVCAGGSGHAFKFAPVLGTITADVLEHKPNRYAHRFAWRGPDQEAGEIGKGGGFFTTPRK